MSQPTGGSGAVSAVMLTSKFMVVAVVSLFTVAFVVSLVYLFAKLCWGLGQAPAAHCDGLDAAVLESLPVTIFRSSASASASDLKEVGVGHECAVCISELSEGDETRVLPKCRHRFHLHCIDMWFQSQSTCPLCRSPVGREDVSYSPETGALLFRDQNGTGYLKAVTDSGEGPSSSISLVIEIPRPQPAEGIPGPGGGEEMKTPPSSTLLMLTKLCSSCSCSASPRGRDIDLGGTAERSTRTNL